MEWAEWSLQWNINFNADLVLEGYLNTSLTTDNAQQLKNSLIKHLIFAVAKRVVRWDEANHSKVSLYFLIFLGQVQNESTLKSHFYNEKCTVIAKWLSHSEKKNSSTFY